MRVKKVLHRKCVISFNKAFLTAVCLILALTFSGGCRPSSVLEQLLYVQDEGNEKAEMMNVWSRPLKTLRRIM